MIHHDILHYRGGTYLWVAIVLVGVSIVLYLTQASADPPNGGTWQGYVLGSVGALLIVWLALLGIRKRGYRSSLGSVRGWTSAHVYLGSAVLIVAALALLWYVIFPAVEPLLPFDDSQIEGP